MKLIRYEKPGHMLILRVYNDNLILERFRSSDENPDLWRLILEVCIKPDHPDLAPVLMSEVFEQIAQFTLNIPPWVTDLILPHAKERDKMA